MNDLKMNSNPDVKIFLVGNKSDLENRRQVSHSEAQNFCKEHAMNFFLEASAKSGINAEKIFVEASKVLLDEFSRYKSKKDNMSDKINSGQDKIGLKAEDTSDPLIYEKASKKKCCWFFKSLYFFLSIGVSVFVKLGCKGTTIFANIIPFG